MISVVIPTLNSAAELPATLTALVPAAVEGIVRDVIVVDGGSKDETEKIAEMAGAEFFRTTKGRGGQLAAGAKVAKGDWLLFLHADTVLQDGWFQEAMRFMERAGQNADHPQAGAFRFRLDDDGIMPRLLEFVVHLRCQVFCAPYGDQGLLISRQAYLHSGGFQAIPLMEDIDLVRRLGCRQLKMFRSEARTSAARYQREGYLRRSSRNLFCLMLYYLRVPPHYLVRLYE